MTMVAKTGLRSETRVNHMVRRSVGGGGDRGRGSRRRELHFGALADQAGLHAQQLGARGRGDHAVQLVAAHQRTSKHRLKLRQLVGLGEERIARSGRDFARAMLPETIDFFPDRGLNRDLFIWLTASIAMLPDTLPTSGDPLVKDLERLHLSAANVDRTLVAFPGLRPVYRKLCEATLAERRRGSLPAVEQLLESKIISMLRAGAGVPDDTPKAIFPHHAPPGYQPMMDVPLWPEFFPQQESGSSAPDSDLALEDPQDGGGKKRFAAERERDDDKRSERSPFILNRFEKILSMAEMVNVDRPTDDSPEENGKAAEDLDEMILGRRRERPSSRFRFDLDLPPEMVDLAEIASDLSYPEWDYRKGTYLKNHCRVLAVPASAMGEHSEISQDTKALIRKVR